MTRSVRTGQRGDASQREVPEQRPIRPLTHAGHDVGLRWRCPDGRIAVVYLDRDGRPLDVGVRVWPHELRGVGWHLAEIKKAAAALPLAPSDPPPPSTRTLPSGVDGAAGAPPPPSRAGGFLSAHFALPTED